MKKKLRRAAKNQLSDGWRRFMQTWSVQAATANFSAILDACLTKGPQLMTDQGAEIAVLLSVQEWRRLQSATQPSLKQLLLSGGSRAELVIPPRSKAQRRNTEAAQ